MGKRSNFERVERDFYPTPLKAFLPVVPYLNKEKKYVEISAGAGAMVDMLRDNNFSVDAAFDIEPRRNDISIQDATTFDYNTFQNTCYITNPPWGRKILHPLLDKFFQSEDKTNEMFLLLDYPWSATKQAIPYLRYCKEIIIVGRIKWIESSKYVSKDDCAWYRFSPFMTNEKYPFLINK